MSKKIISLIMAFSFMSVMFLFFQRGGHEKTEQCYIPRVRRSNIAEINNRNAIEIYFRLKKHTDEKNIFYSPYSLLSALLMTYEGARSLTEEEIRRALHLPEDKEILRRSYKESEERSLRDKNDEGSLSVFNALWAEEEFSFSNEYFEVIEKFYGGKVKKLDFKEQAENSRMVINENIKERTDGKIAELLPRGAVDALTRLVITNAIRFSGVWEKAFVEELTRERDFYSDQDGTFKVSMMQMAPNGQNFNYLRTEKIEMLELPYEEEGLSMLILLHEEGLDPLTSKLSHENLMKWEQDMRKTRFDDIFLPKFKFDTKYSMVEVLKEMGISSAFKFGEADLSGMTGEKDLFINDVFHQASIKVDEKGTEAAAATGVVIGITSIRDEKVFRADRPFLFLIRDRKTGIILFLGSVSDPR